MIGVLQLGLRGRYFVTDLLLVDFKIVEGVSSK